MTATDTIVARRGHDPSEPRRVLRGDRFCTRCGYNLVGQEIVKEEHYSLLIVRCPECATVTGLQEYPLLRTWGTRWGIVLAALWLLVILAMWPASAGIILGFSVGVADEGSRNYARYLTELHEAAEPPSAQAPAQAVPAPASNALPPGTIIIQGATIVRTSSGSGFEKWWAQQDQPAVLAAAGGWLGTLHKVELLLLIPASVLAVFVGCFWSVALMQVPRRYLVFVVVAIIVLACALSIIPLAEWHSRGAYSARFAAQYQLGMPTLFACFGLLTLPLSLGLWLGRPLVRLAVRALLPPRLRGPIAVLWTADGIDPPTGEPGEDRRVRRRPASTA